MSMNLKLNILLRSFYLVCCAAVFKIMPSYYCLFLCVVLLSLLLHPAGSLVIFFNNNSNLTLQSAFTILGHPPKQTIRSNIIFLAINNFSDNCRFSQFTNETSIQGNFVVVEKIPKWYKCVFDDKGFAPAVGRLLQKAGAIGVLFPPQEKVFIPLLSLSLSPPSTISLPSLSPLLLSSPFLPFSFSPLSLSDPSNSFCSKHYIDMQGLYASTRTCSFGPFYCCSIFYNQIHQE